jgi:hypothetical protein
MGALERQQDALLSAPPRVDDEEVADMPADAACGSHLSRGWVQTRRPMDAPARSPGAVAQWRSLAIGTGRAEDKGGNSRC